MAKKPFSTDEIKQFVKMKPDRNSSKLDKVSAPPKGIEYPTERVVKKQPSRRKKY